MLGGLRIGSPLGEGGDTVVDFEVDTVGSDSRLDCALVELVSNLGAYSDKKSAILPRRKMPPITRTSPTRMASIAARSAYYSLPSACWPSEEYPSAWGTSIAHTVTPASRSGRNHDRW